MFNELNTLLIVWYGWSEKKDCNEEQSGDFSRSWWRHQMETFSALLAICAGNSSVSGGFPTHKGQWRGALMFSLICAWINGWVNAGEAGNLRRHHTHYDVIVMIWRHYWPVMNPVVSRILSKRASIAELLWFICCYPLEKAAETNNWVVGNLRRHDAHVMPL